MVRSECCLRNPNTTTPSDRQHSTTELKRFYRSTYLRGGEIMGCPRRNVIEFYKRLHDQLIVKDKQSGKHQHLRQYIPQLWLFKISKGVLSPLLMNARNEVERWTKKNETPANKRVSSLKSRFCGRHASSLRSRDGGRLSHAVVLDLIRRCGVSLARLCSGSVVRDHQLFGKENRRFH